LLDLQLLAEEVSSLGYLGALVAGLLGSSSLFVSLFPSYIVIALLGGVLNPVIVGLLGGVGAGVGQFLHYYIGLGGRYLIPDRWRGRLDAWLKKLDKFGVLLIFAFAATPLTPDDVIWIPLGAMRYPKLKALIAAVSGKVLLNLIYAYAGRFFLGYFTHFFT
jgi:uncharacterized membrane protein YdjX (TVP38/TMEM64 family)